MDDWMRVRRRTTEVVRLERDVVSGNQDALRLQRSVASIEILLPRWPLNRPDRGLSLSVHR